jgi:hypothetical protein
MRRVIVKQRQPKKSLADAHPKLAIEWHPSQNGPLTPKDITSGSNKRVWWQCRVCSIHEWQASISGRVAGNGCPMCDGKIPTPRTSLRALNPALAAEWHPTKNGALTPDDVTAGSGKKVWWRCSLNVAHEWQSDVVHRANGTGCPVCANRVVTTINSLAVLKPELALEWHPTKNGDLTP